MNSIEIEVAHLLSFVDDNACLVIGCRLTYGHGGQHDLRVPAGSAPCGICDGNRDIRPPATP